MSSNENIEIEDDLPMEIGEQTTDTKPKVAAQNRNKPTAKTQTFGAKPTADTSNINNQAQDIKAPNINNTSDPQEPNKPNAEQQTKNAQATPAKENINQSTIQVKNDKSKKVQDNSSSTTIPNELEQTIGLDENSQTPGNAKQRIIKGSIVAVVVIFILYTLFKKDPQSDESQQSTEVTDTSPVESIDFSNRPKAAVPTKLEVKEVNKVDNIDTTQTPKDLTPLPNDVYSILNRPTTPELPDLSKIEPSGEIPKPPELPTSPFGPKEDPNAKPPIDPQNVVQNGIPIVNSADMTPQQKREMNMFVLSGSGPMSDNVEAPKTNDKDFIVLDGSTFVEKKKKSNVKAEKVDNLDTTLVQGKILDATLETAINSELPGPVRAIISYDVYGEIGNKVLIPRGSRLFGTYSSTVKRGQARIDITWSRILRPDGISITISAKASDQFGRAGIDGDVDNRLTAAIASSLLFSGVQVGAAMLLDQISGNQGQTQTVNSNGTFTTTNVKAFNVAAQSAINTASSMIQNLIGDGSDFTQVNSLPQGTRTKVIILQDITLPQFRKAYLPS